MPKGNPTSQTIASEKYQKKAGIIAKSYKLKKDLTDEFAQACERAGKSQASVISDFMREFIDNN